MSFFSSSTEGNIEEISSSDHSCKIPTPDIFEFTSDSNRDEHFRRSPSRTVLSDLHSVNLQISTSTPVATNVEEADKEMRKFRCVLKGVKAFIDTERKSAHGYRLKLRKLGALVYCRITKTVTHVIFWNGKQRTLDLAQQMNPRPFIISYHWILKQCMLGVFHIIFRCFEQRKHVSENPYLLYGLTDLAVPLEEMALGRIGIMKKDSKGISAKNIKKRKKFGTRNPLKSNLTEHFLFFLQIFSIGADILNEIRLVKRLNCKFIEVKQNELCVNEIPPCSQILYSMEKLSDQLALRITSPESDQIVSPDQIISPILARFKMRCMELYKSSVRFARDFPRKSVDAATNTTPEHVDLFESSADDRFSNFSNEIPSAKISTFLRKSAKNSKSILNLTSMRTPVDHLSTNEITATLNQMVLDPSVVRQTSGKNVADLSRSSVSEKRKKSGRPPITSGELLEFGPDDFNKHILRRGSTKVKQAIRMNAKQAVDVYRSIFDKTQSEPEVVPKARPVTVRTKSKILNDLQIMPSSEEFVRFRHKKAARKIGNIVLSKLEKILETSMLLVPLAVGDLDSECFLDSFKIFSKPHIPTLSEYETVVAIVKRLGVLTVMKEVDQQTRYVVCDTMGSITNSVLDALVACIPIVTSEWAYRSLEMGGWLNGVEYLVSKWKKSFKIRKKGHPPRLFAKLGCFFISVHCDLAISESLNRASIVIAPNSDWHLYANRRLLDGSSLSVVSERWIFVYVGVCVHSRRHHDDGGDGDCDGGDDGDDRRGRGHGRRRGRVRGDGGGDGRGHGRRRVHGRRHGRRRVHGRGRGRDRHRDRQGRPHLRKHQFHFL
ncbi:unnamed protein product [Dracunculus medinensis]|uniref:BRCT domain-containing protein n=1 Tax=Dracunculus medinensis TaxID=318479 RepID=A0A0N4U7D8_DRAME|nr:unnamed protein product [Dracunculus medinensis]